jgi:hypothetical protein
LRVMTESAMPFLGSEALAAGTFSKRTLYSRNQLIHRNVYLQRGHTLTPTTRAIAAWLWSRRLATVAGLSAAALHGTRWIDAQLPAELCRVEGATNGIVVHRDVLCTRKYVWSTESRSRLLRARHSTSAVAVH